MVLPGLPAKLRLAYAALEGGGGRGGTGFGWGKKNSFLCACNRLYFVAGVLLCSRYLIALHSTLIYLPSKC